MSIQNFLSQYSYVIELLKTLMFFFVAFVLFIKTGDIKFLKEVIKKDMRYRNEHYYEQEGVPSGQDFVKVVPIYRKNKSTGLLEKTEETIDLQELIDSALETCLERSLERLMPSSDVDNQVVEYNAMRDDLDELQSMSELAENYKEKFNLDSSLSFAEVFDIVGKKANELKAEIDKAKQNTKQKMEVVETIKQTVKESKGNEKETIKESE